MNFNKIIVIFGIVLSIGLLIVILIRLDWQTFFITFKTIHLPQVWLAILAIVIGIGLRSLRWNLITDLPLTHFKHFWQAFNIGYLGNFIYPARAGEILRIGAIHHFTPLKLGHAATSVVIDRMIDFITLGLFALIILWLHGRRIDPSISTGVIGILFLATLFSTLLIVYVDSLYIKAQDWVVKKKWQQIKIGYLHILEGIHAFRRTHNLLIILFLSFCISFMDFFTIWQIMQAFSWLLNFDAALTVGVFLGIGISLPSTPGHVGIYQVACILALGLYNIGESSAVAYSLVLQLISFVVVGLQGGMVVAYCGFNLSKEKQLAISKINDRHLSNSTL